MTRIWRSVVRFLYSRPDEAPELYYEHMSRAELVKHLVAYSDALHAMRHEAQITLWRLQLLEKAQTMDIKFLWTNSLS